MGSREGPSGDGGHERDRARKAQRAVGRATVGQQPVQLCDHRRALRAVERRVQAATVPVFAGHPGPETGGVLQLERLAQRLGMRVGEARGAMDLGGLRGIADATEGPRVVRSASGAQIAVTTRPPGAVTRRSSRSVATGSAAIIRARRLTAAPKRPSGNGSP